MNPVTLNGFPLFGCSTGVNKARSGRLQNHLGVESESVVSVNGLGRFDLVDAANKEKLTMLEYLKKKKMYRLQRLRKSCWPSSTAVKELVRVKH